MCAYAHIQAVAPLSRGHHPVESSRVRSSPVQSSQVQSGQVRSSQVKSGRVGSGRVGSGRVGSSQVKSGQNKSSQVRSSQFRSCRVGSGRVGSGQVRSGQVKSSRFRVEDASTHKYTQALASTDKQAPASKYQQASTQASTSKRLPASTSGWMADWTRWSFPPRVRQRCWVSESRLIHTAMVFSPRVGQRCWMAHAYTCAYTCAYVRTCIEASAVRLAEVRRHPMEQLRVHLQRWSSALAPQVLLDHARRDRDHMLALPIPDEIEGL